MLCMNKNMKCKHCSKEFQIYKEDQDFYKKINVPEPTFCPECRQQRRFAFRNERVLYSGKCGLCGIPTVGIYSANYPGPVYCLDCWWSDKWDSTQYGKDYDSSKSFFEQFKDLMYSTPVPASINIGSVNSIYSVSSLYNKNCYMVISCLRNEDCYYSYQLLDSRDILDGFYARESELGYELVDAEKMYGSKFCYKTQNCNDSAFLYDCNSCTKCFMSTNLRNKSYVFKNKQLTKEEYEKQISKIDFGSYKIIEELKKEYKNIVINAIHKFTNQIKCENSVGDHLLDCKDCFMCFDVKNAENSRYSITSPGPLKDCYDVNYATGELHCDVMSCVGGTENKFVGYCWGRSNVEYSWHVMNSENCFGCSGMNKKQYCILNKQYSKEEYIALRAKIVDDMKKRGEYGEFFPATLSPFGYNETISNDMLPLKKEDAALSGFNWCDNLPGTRGKETVVPNSLPDNIKETQDQIIKEVLACVSCGRNYKIVVQELEFYKKINIPLPRKCFDCRHMERMNMRNPRHLYHRKCANCTNEFETTYASDRPEKVYCETCYQKEVL